MSTLTKVLIVLLTVFSLFLCGIVVTYVANADNYQQLYSDTRTRLQSAQAREEAAQEQLKKTTEDAELQHKQLEDQLSALNIKITELQAQLDDAERKKAQLQERTDRWAAVTEDFNKTNDQQLQWLKTTRAELERLRQEQIKERAQLDETTTAVVEKMAIITTLEDKNRNLLEENKDLENKLNQLLRQYGKAIISAEPVTPRKAAAVPTPTPTRDIGLNGVVRALDLKHSLAEISIGSVNGVKQDMKFHVTRGDKFICDILILDVQPEKSVGILETIQEPPSVGDRVSTNL